MVGGARYVFNDCTFTGSGLIAPITTDNDDATDAKKAYLRELTLSGCTATSISQTGAVLNTTDMNYLLVRNCTFTNSSTSATGYFVTLNDLRGEAIIDNSTITSEFCINTRNYTLASASITIQDCTLVNADTASGADAQGRVYPTIAVRYRDSGTTDTQAGIAAVTLLAIYLKWCSRCSCSQGTGASYDYHRRHIGCHTLAYRGLNGS